MKGRKGWVYAGLLATSVLVLQGCGGGNNTPGNSGTSGGDSDTNTNAGTETVTLKVWGDLGNQAVLESAYNEINAAFEEQHSDIKLQYDFAQNDQSLSVALQANELPDLFIVQGDKTPKMAEMVRNGFLMPLDDYNLDLSRFTESEIAYGTVEGKLYSSLPAFLDTQLVYYNKDIFADNGIEMPGTWDEFVAALDTLKAAGITPISLAGKQEWDRAWPVYALAAAHASPQLQAIAEGAGDLTAPEIGQAFQYYRDFADNGYFGKDFLAQDTAAAQFAFTNGKAAMIIDGTWNNSTYEDSGLNLGRFSVPNAEGKRIVAPSYSNFMTYAVSADAEHPDQAVKYIEFLNGQEAQQILENHAGLIPTISDIEPKNEAVSELANFDEAGGNIYSLLSTLATADTNTPDIMMKDLNPKLLTSKITGEEAAQTLHEAANYEK
ncbi:extracellular solute-binding protein [Paenibacillus sp. IB182496]|uniref:Extracellular solute-binding protein n=1 Tax=Paenibacillus sabuli TaxID=2772509 RepID=A0A927BZC9_9BACL|nr:extracellular solute-binding protein [Paenibacillus sabuli]MBD2848380.1 extracellular solute-binding protein [Paenibacillus sabuli]